MLGETAARKRPGPGARRAPAIIFGKVAVPRAKAKPGAKPARPAPPVRRPNKETRGREHLTHAEVEQLAAAAARRGRHGSRDALMIRTAYRHGLRVSELVDLRRDQLDLGGGRLTVRRRKRGTDATHPMDGREIREFRRLLRGAPEGTHVFVSERGGPLTDSAVRKMIARAGVAAGLPLPVHPHMLRHATGYHLANKGRDTRTIQAYLGHRNIQHTVRYTALAADRFKGLWDD
jgi:type 1 fimbriae regulatory protein FimB/type 1 fimbriae regulatory protein FimE